LGSVYTYTMYFCVCVCVFTPWPIDNWALSTPNTALYLSIGASPHLTVTCRSKRNHLKTHYMLGNNYDLLFLLTRHHIMESFNTNSVSTCQKCMCMRAQLLIRWVRVPATHTGKLAKIRSLLCRIFWHWHPLTFEMNCVYCSVCALCVCECVCLRLKTIGKFDAQCNCSKVHSQLNSSFYQ
jgi:hypothetical protein